MVRKKKKRNKTSRRKSAFRSKYPIIILVIILIALSIFLLISLNIIENPFKKIARKSLTIEATDECALIAGKLINPISDEGTCKNICLARCESQSRDLKSSEFEERTNSCNSCICNCK